ncbi:hypothetical protein [Cytobacillus pseudoceanisediminis]|uniref:hypothetical protein n=1 Tax=Cytobacillus pseudoceanisediminis TaxID=3051614 RepID=UPI003C2CC654
MELKERYGAAVGAQKHRKDPNNRIVPLGEARKQRMELKGAETAKGTKATE